MSPDESVMIMFGLVLASDSPGTEVESSGAIAPGHSQGGQAEGQPEMVGGAKRKVVREKDDGPSKTNNTSFEEASQVRVVWGKQIHCIALIVSLKI